MTNFALNAKCSWTGVPIYHYLHSVVGPENSKKLYDALQDMHVTMSPPVRSHKEKLGRQAFCVTTWYRAYVWETDHWRVVASNRRGIVFELRENVLEFQIVNAWNDYAQKVGGKTV